MRPIPTIFLRQFEDGIVLNIWRESCRWVREGEGIAVRKWDGECCLVQDGHYYKRHVVHLNEQAPPEFVAVDTTYLQDTVGWLPVTASPNDKWYCEAIRNGLPENGTYELVGPCINGNKDGFDKHQLIRHTGGTDLEAPRTFDGLLTFFSYVHIEGIVWHRGNGDMAKIKRADFGFPW